MQTQVRRVLGKPSQEQGACIFTDEELEHCSVGLSCKPQMWAVYGVSSCLVAILNN